MLSEAMIGIEHCGNSDKIDILKLNKNILL